VKRMGSRRHCCYGRQWGEEAEGKKSQHNLEAQHRLNGLFEISSVESAFSCGEEAQQPTHG